MDTTGCGDALSNNGENIIHKATFHPLPRPYWTMWAICCTCISPPSPGFALHIILGALPYK
jgi:hypothetical protein